MRLYGKYFIIAVIFGILQVLYLFQFRDKMLFSDVIFISSFFKPDFYLPNALNMFLDYIPLIILQILYGTYLYRHFCTASIYYFSRCKNRTMWLLKEAVKLYGYIGVYLVIMFTSRTMFCMLNFKMNFDSGSIYLLCYYLIIYSLWLYITVLAINLIAIFVGSQFSIVVLLGIQGIFILLLQIFDQILPFEKDPKYYGKLLQLNPIAHLVMSWHSSEITSVNNLSNVLDISFPFYETIITFGVLAIAVTVLGCVITKRAQFIVLNRETGGV